MWGDHSGVLGDDSGHQNQYRSVLGEHSGHGVRTQRFSRRTPQSSLENTVVMKFRTALFSEKTAVMSRDHRGHGVRTPLCSLREPKSSDSTPQFSGEKTAVMWGEHSGVPGEDSCHENQYRGYLGRTPRFSRTRHQSSLEMTAVISEMTAKGSISILCPMLEALIRVCHRPKQTFGEFLKTEQ
jgi:hypothetical protein